MSGRRALDVISMNDSGSRTYLLEKLGVAGRMDRMGMTEGGRLRGKDRSGAFESGGDR